MPPREFYSCRGTASCPILGKSRCGRRAEPALLPRTGRLPLLPTEFNIVTADDFRSIALSLPEAAESAHMGHPDFRVRGKIFATLGPDEAWGMVKLTPEQQGQFNRAEPEVFVPIPGG